MNFIWLIHEIYCIALLRDWLAEGNLFVDRKDIQIHDFMTGKKKKKENMAETVILALREGMLDDKQLLGNKIKSEHKIMQFNMSSA